MAVSERSEFHEPDWVEATEVARMLGRRRSAITRYVHNGQLVGVKKFGRLFIHRESLASFKFPLRGNPKLRA